MLGLAEDYDALCEQIGQGQTLLAEVDLQIREAPGPISQELVTKVTSAPACPRLPPVPGPLSTSHCLFWGSLMPGGP